MMRVRSKYLCAPLVVKVSVPKRKRLICLLTFRDLCVSFRQVIVLWSLFQAWRTLEQRTGWAKLRQHMTMQEAASLGLQGVSFQEGNITRLQLCNCDIRGGWSDL